MVFDIVAARINILISNKLLTSIALLIQISEKLIDLSTGNPMKIKDESKVFYHSVYAVIEKIPYGKATSYGMYIRRSIDEHDTLTVNCKGHIAYLVNRPQNSRLVGSSLKHLKFIAESLNREATAEDVINTENIPWWRVILSAGKISPRGNSDNESRQAKLLREEGVVVLEAYHIDLDEYGWFPDEVDF